MSQKVNIGNHEYEICDCCGKPIWNEDAPEVPICPVAKLDEQAGERKSGYSPPGAERKSTKGGGGYHGNMPDTYTVNGTYGDSGGASRFYHQAGWEHERAECAEGCPVAKLDEQAGQRRGGNHIRRSRGNEADGNEHVAYGKFEASDTLGHDISGGASRFYAQADWEHERAEMACCSDCPVAKLDEQAGECITHATGKNPQMGNIGYGSNRGKIAFEGYEGSEGGASRFYHNADWTAEIAERLATGDPVRYCPKAAKRERNEGLDAFFWRKDKASPTGFVRVTREEWEALGEEEQRVKAETGKRVSLRARGNVHVAIKPISLCKWLASLLLPPKEYAPRRIVIPFCGTFSEGIGAMLAGWDKVVGIDFIEDYVDMSEARAAFWSGQPIQLELMEEPT